MKVITTVTKDLQRQQICNCLYFFDLFIPFCQGKDSHLRYFLKHSQQVSHIVVYIQFLVCFWSRENF